jgi:hypothetical protein
MEPQSNRTHPYTLKSGEGWICRFSIDFTIKASKIAENRGGYPGIRHPKRRRTA